MKNILYYMELRENKAKIFDMKEYDRSFFDFARTVGMETRSALNWI